MAQGFALFAGVSPSIVTAAAREAETLGYTSFWVNHPGATDGLLSLAQAASVTRKIDLGIGVIPLHTRGPESIIEGVRSQALPLDRLLLGVGSPNPDSLARVRGGIATLRAGLRTRLIVAALGPKMCELAGEVADGVLFNWLTPEHARASAELVRQGAAKAKHKPPTLFAYVRLAVGAAGGECVRRGLFTMAYAANFRRMGVDPSTTAIAVSRADMVAPALAQWRGVVDEVVLRALPGEDTAEETVTLVRAAAPR